LRGCKEESKVFFSEENKQKTFAYSGVGAAREGRDSIRKVFWFFSSEKNIFLLPDRILNLFE
jgi:hypothetical protein